MGMRLNLNLDALRPLSMVEKRVALFDAIGKAMRIPALVEDMLGNTRAARASMQGGGSKFMTGGDKIEAPTMDEIKSYLTSEKAGRLLPGGQKWAVPADNPILTGIASRIQTFYHENIVPMDLGWQTFFDFVDMRQANEDHIQLIGTNLGVTYEQIGPGGAIKSRRLVSENQVLLSYLTYGAGISLLDDWLRFNKFYTIQEVIDEFFSQYYDNQASLHYGLFTALSSGVNVAFTVDDATTFNAGAAALLRGLQNAGVGISSNTQLDILVAPEKVGRILAAIDAKRGSPMIAFGTQKQPIAFNIGSVISSVKVPSSDAGYYLVLSGRKNKRVVWNDLFIESDREPAVGATDWFGKGKFNAVIGNSAQVKRVLFA